MNNKKINKKRINYYGIFLLVLLIVISVVVLLESFFQLNRLGFSFLGIAREHGYLLQYKVSDNPSHGIWHPLGWIGTACFFIMMLYSLRKQAVFMQEVGPMRYWLDTHIFLGLLGTILILVHSTFKFGGIVSISFWSMVLVTVSGVFGRYIYIKIPRSIMGNELRTDEIETLLKGIDEKMGNFSEKNEKVAHYLERITGPKNLKDIWLLTAIFKMVYTDIINLIKIEQIRWDLRRTTKLSSRGRAVLLRLIMEKGTLLRYTNFLSISHRLLHYWHVFHKPLAVIMFIIMFLHIIITQLFRV